MDSLAELDKTGFTAKVGVESGSEPPGQLLGPERSRRPLGVALCVGAGVVCLVILVVGSLAFKDQLSPGSAVNSRPISDLRSSKLYSISSKRSTRSSGPVLTASKASGIALSPPARIWRSVKQRPKMAAAIASIIAITVIGAVVASVLLLRPSQTHQADVVSAQEKLVQPNPLSSLNIGAIVGGIVAVVVAAIVVILLVKFKPWSKYKQNPQPQNYINPQPQGNPPPLPQGNPSQPQVVPSQPQVVPSPQAVPPPPEDDPPPPQGNPSQPQVVPSQPQGNPPPPPRDNPSSPRDDQNSNSASNHSSNYTSCETSSDEALSDETSSSSS